MCSMTRIIVILLLFLITTVVPCIAEPVHFRHKTSGAVKTNCVKIQGRHDRYPICKCFDKAGELQPFDPGTEWEEAELKEVCFRHTVRDTIKSNCLEILGKESNAQSFGCFDERKNLKPFEPGTKWKKIEGDHPDCKKTGKRDDVPRGFPEKSGGGGNEQEQ